MVMVTDILEKGALKLNPILIMVTSSAMAPMVVMVVITVIPTTVVTTVISLASVALILNPILGTDMDTHMDILTVMVVTMAATGAKLTDQNLLFLSHPTSLNNFYLLPRLSN